MSLLYVRELTYFLLHTSQNFTCEIFPENAVSAQNGLLQRSGFR